MSDTPPASVFVVAREFPPHIGGLERQMSLVAGHLATHGARVSVWTATAGATPPPSVDVNVRPRWARPMPVYLLWLALSLTAARLRHRRGPAVAIVSRVSAEAGLLSRLGPLLRLPFVTMVVTGDQRGCEWAQQRRRWVRDGVRKHGAALVTHTQALADELRAGGYDRPIVVIPVLATAERDRGCSADLSGSSPLVWCGRDDPVKNLRALERIHGDHLGPEGWGLLMIVDRPVRCDGGAQVHVACPSPRTHLAGSAALVVTSLYEGQSNAVVEAALEGVPTVAYATGGTPETLAHLGAGETISLGAGDAAFANAVRRVALHFTDTNARCELQARARAVHVLGAGRAWGDLVGRLTGPTPQLETQRT